MINEMSDNLQRNLIESSILTKFLPIIKKEYRKFTHPIGSSPSPFTSSLAGSCGEGGGRAASEVLSVDGVSLRTFPFWTGLFELGSWWPF